MFCYWRPAYCSASLSLGSDVREARMDCILLSDLGAGSEVLEIVRYYYYIFTYIHIIQLSIISKNAYYPIKSRKIKQTNKTKTVYYRDINYLSEPVTIMPAAKLLGAWIYIGWSKNVTNQLRVVMCLMVTTQSRIRSLPPLLFGWNMYIGRSRKNYQVLPSFICL